MSFFSKSSPYYTTAIVNGYLDIMTFRDIPNEADDILFEVTSTYENRPDLLAYDLYQNERLWWVFSMRNKRVLKDPIYDLVAGTKIYLPKYSTLQRVLGI
jgi:hypothetical protein